MRTYDYRHIVTFEETNVVGNVYYVNHLRWQGICRELFLREHAPGVLTLLREGLQLVTTRCSCAYFAQLEAMNEIVVRMSLVELGPSRVTMGFGYERDGELVARGDQEIAMMQAGADGIAPAPVPEELRAALEPYRA